MASASGSQTDGHSGADEESSSEEIDDDGGDYLHLFNTGRRHSAFVMEGDGGAAAARRALAGDGGRGEHVLVERRSFALKEAARGVNDKRMSWDGLRTGQWGATLFDGPTKVTTPKRRSSPSLAPKGKPRRPPQDVPRPPTPPLTFDSIQSTYNPFPHFNIRWNLVPEVVLLVSALAVALYRLDSMVPSSTYPTIRSLPIISLSLLAAAIPFIAIGRRPSSYLKVPFTDERGYRDPKAADDGVAAALVLPILLASACYWDTYSEPSPATSIRLQNIAPLVEVWAASGVHAVPPSPATALLGSPLETARALLQARHQLVLLTALNAAVLISHFVLAATVLKIERLPKSNTKRFFGFMTLSGIVTTGIYLVFVAWDWGVKGALPLLRGHARAALTASQTASRSRHSKRESRLSSSRRRSTSSHA